MSYSNCLNNMYNVKSAYHSNYIAGNPTLRISHKLGPCQQTSLVSPPQCQSYVEQIPFERNYVEYVPQQKIDYIPVQKEYQDIVEIQHDIDYVPVPRVEKYIEHIPIEKYQTHYDYIPQESCYLKSPDYSYNTSNYNYSKIGNYNRQRLPCASFGRYEY